jgi:hypothetical protein
MFFSKKKNVGIIIVTSYGEIMQVRLEMDGKSCANAKIRGLAVKEAQGLLCGLSMF